MELTACPRAHEVDRRALSERDDDPELQGHLETCGTCRERVAQNARLAELARGIARPSPQGRDVQRLRAVIVRGAIVRERRRIVAAPLAFVATAALAFGVAGVVRPRAEHTALPPRPVATAPSPLPVLSPSAFAAVVVGEEGARWTQRRDGDVERVTLDDGLLALSVRHQTDAERFFVALPDGEIEVRGTRFDVAVHDRRTTRVHVTEGLVALRIGDAAPHLVAAGEVWSGANAVAAAEPAVIGSAAAAEPAVRSPVAVPPAAAPSVAVAATSAPPVAPAAVASARPDVVRDPFAAAMALYRTSKYDAAARAFAAIAGAPSARATAREDALYMEAASLARADRTDEAAAAAAQFVATYGESIHARAAAILVARAARDRGDCAAVRAVLDRWLARPDASPDVVSAAGTCASPSSAARSGAR